MLIEKTIQNPKTSFRTQTEPYVTDEIAKVLKDPAGLAALEDEIAKIKELMS